MEKFHENPYHLNLWEYVLGSESKLQAVLDTHKEFLIGLSATLRRALPNSENTQSCIIFLNATWASYFSQKYHLNLSKASENILDVIF